MMTTTSSLPPVPVPSAVSDSQDSQLISVTKSLLLVQSRLIEVGSVTGAATQSMNCACSPAAASAVVDGSAEADSELDAEELWFSKVEALSSLMSESTSPGGEQATL